MKSATLKLTAVVWVLFVLSATSHAALIEVGFEAGDGFNTGSSVVGTSVSGATSDMKVRRRGLLEQLAI